MQRPLWQWVLGLAVLAALFFAVRDGFNKDIPMSRTSRVIRIVGGSLWAGILIFGMLLELYEAIR